MEQLFSHDELALITAAAEEAGMPPREWVRGVVLQYLTEDPEDLYEDARATVDPRASGGAPYRPDLEHALWPMTSHRRSGRTMLEVHHAGCWVPKGGEETMTTAQAREQLLAGNARPCDACLPERFLTPSV
ncbi:DUF6233 domain-containing protein [Streptomyces sp. ISL-11]|uniref:DUF6233 domain-containing protein n=1 Tax=Streptomyces sp. ISL-11 TaxID=2819174 RepID=UPI001BEC5463|nr:DUF6233 domain-containing protein [Streptomyces sp. ISL-11]MBT2385707.1 hypothetical protein [Streptomyces sp. ISL-11]